MSAAASSSLVRFLITGLLNTLLGLGIIYALKLAEIHDLAANLLGYVLGIGISYAMHARWSFSYAGSVRTSLPRYVLITILAYLTNLAVVSIALYWWKLNGYVAQALGVAPYALVGYLGSKLFVFRRATP